LSTHVALAARAFGATGIIYTGDKDKGLEESIEKVVLNWGGSFKLKHAESWRNEISKWNGKIIHLTMYGLPVLEVITEIKEFNSNFLIVVGGAKVPGELYNLVDWNVAITSQPHSEVSALAVFLHEFFRGSEQKNKFNDAKRHIIPHEKRKQVETKV
jgi:tRNA (cytidine56-2'-O)-methyltransferase